MSGSFRKRGKTAAILLAAGGSTRFLAGREGVKKPFVEVCGVPVLIRSARTLEASSLIDEIIIVTGENEVESCLDLVDQYQVTKIKSVVVGGSTRQESAKIGLDAISDDMKYVAIHDAARCLVTREDVEKVIHRAYVTGAAIAACRPNDTIKTGSKDGMVLDSPDRSTIWCAQTPQVFLSNLYRAAAYMAEKDRFSATDDASLVEKLGCKVALVECGKYNLKITDPFDAKVAEVLFKEMELLHK